MHLEEPVGDRLEPGAHDLLARRREPESRDRAGRVGRIVRAALPGEEGQHGQSVRVGRDAGDRARRRAPRRAPRRRARASGASRPRSCRRCSARRRRRRGGDRASSATARTARPARRSVVQIWRSAPEVPIISAARPRVVQFAPTLLSAPSPAAGIQRASRSCGQRRAIAADGWPRSASSRSTIGPSWSGEIPHATHSSASHRSRSWTNRPVAEAWDRLSASRPSQRRSRYAGNDRPAPDAAERLRFAIREPAQPRRPVGRSGSGSRCARGSRARRAARAALRLRVRCACRSRG